MNVLAIVDTGEQTLSEYMSDNYSRFKSQISKIQYYLEYFLFLRLK